MKPIPTLLTLLAAFSTTLSAAPAAQPAQIAFPSAEGFGAVATGGRGG